MISNTCCFSKTIWAQNPHTCVSDIWYESTPTTPWPLWLPILMACSEYKIVSVAPFVAFTTAPMPSLLNLLLPFMFHSTLCFYWEILLLFSNSASAWRVCLSLISVDINLWLLERKNAAVPPSSPCCLLKTEDSKRE